MFIFHKENSIICMQDIRYKPNKVINKQNQIFGFLFYILLYYRAQFINNCMDILNILRKNLIT